MIKTWFGFRKREARVQGLRRRRDAGHGQGDRAGCRKRQEEQEEQAPQKPKLRPGAVLLKYFHNIASADLNALFPDVRVVMSWRDQLMLGVPALIGGVPILLKLASTVTVLFLIAGFYLGFRARCATRNGPARWPR